MRSSGVRSRFPNLIFPLVLTSFTIFFQVVIAPPLYRHRPLWYQKDLAQVASRFSSALSADRPPNLHILPSFMSQDLLPDGVHLTPVSGLHYVLHVFDQTEAVLALVTQNSDSKICHVQEVVRQHDDRLVFIENRHQQLSVSHDIKIASDAEFRDWMVNRSEEDWLTILGLPRLSGNFTPREWQVAAKKQVAEFFEYVLNLHKIGLNFNVLYVGNPNRNRTGIPALNVRMNSVDVSKRLREIYSGFFRRVNPIKLPSKLKNISVRNKVTHDTRIRIEILRQLGRNYKSSNPTAIVDVRGYDPRPLLVLKPSSGSDTKIQTFNFIEAVTTLPPVLSDESLSRIFPIVGGRHKGALQAHFVILSDDDRERCHGLSRRPRGPAPTSSSAQASTIGGTVSGGGSGVDLEAGFLASLRSAPPPPPTKTTSSTPDADSHERDHSPRSPRSPRRESGGRDRSCSRQRSSCSPPRDPERDEAKRKRRRSDSESSEASASSSPSGSSSSSTSSGRSRSRSHKHGRSSKYHRSKKSRKSVRFSRSKSGKSGKSGGSSKSGKTSKRADSDRSDEERTSAKSSKSGKSSKTTKTAKRSDSNRSDEERTREK